MTPTEQDNELREAILLEFKNVHRLAPADYTENCTNVVMQLITADRKRVALEARIHEIGLMQHQARVNLKTSNAVAEWGDIRIAELKAHQEKV